MFRNSFDLFLLNKMLHTTLWLYQKWVDDRLAWNPDDSNGIKHLQLLDEEVWKPNLYSANGKIELVQNSVNDKMNQVIIFPDGQVTYFPTIKVKQGLDLIEPVV